MPLFSPRPRFGGEGMGVRGCFHDHHSRSQVVPRPALASRGCRHIASRLSMPVGQSRRAHHRRAVARLLEVHAARIDQAHHFSRLRTDSGNFDGRSDDQYRSAHGHVVGRLRSSVDAHHLFHLGDRPRLPRHGRRDRPGHRRAAAFTTAGTISSDPGSFPDRPGSDSDFVLEPVGGQLARRLDVWLASLGSAD